MHTIVIDAENQSSVDFRKFRFQTVGVIKDAAYKFDRCYIRIRTIRIKKIGFSKMKSLLSWFTEQLFGCNPIL
jgi:hypothetical protein